MKSVLVTGAARGLGLAICQSLSGARYRVIGTGRNITPEFEKLVRESEQDQITFVPYDLNDVSGIPAFVTSITKNVGPLYGLINNAGIGLDGVLATQHGSDISKILRVNLESSIIMTKYACRSMLMKREGRIVNISSIIASTGFSGLAAYAASKAGMEGFARALSRELGKANITVNCVAPGFMETDMTAGLGDTHMDSIRRRAPLGLPKVEDVGGAILFLLSPAGARITGTVLTVDGGSTA